jgi:hypothetical protein
LGSTLPPLIKEGLKLLQPTLLNTYKRKYYLSSCKRFRITLDFDIKSYPLKILNDSLPLSPIEERKFILELKYSDKCRDEARMVINSLPYKQSRNSKYVNGMGDEYA